MGKFSLADHIQSAQPPKVRDIETITAEILDAKRVGGEAILTIGKGLIEAKAMGTRAYTVSLKVREQYLGDVTGYQAQIDALEEDKVRLETDRAAQEDSIQRLTEQLAEADEMAISLYEELEAAQEQLPAEEPDETAAPDQNGEPDESGEVAE